MENSERKNKLFWIIPIMLLIIILILLSFCITFGKVEEPNYIPTGNVDVFDIDISCYCDDSKTNTKDTDNKTKKCVTTDKYGYETEIKRRSSGKKESNNSEENEQPDDDIIPDEEDGESDPGGNHFRCGTGLDADGTEDPADAGSGP